MAKKNEITVKDVTIKTMTINGIDYICITDIARQKNAVEPKDVVKNWMLQKNTLEYLGLWERLNNANFKGVEFAPLLGEAGSNSFNIRDYATINELICLSNMENINAVLISDGVPQGERLVKLNQIAIQQMQVLENNEDRKIGSC